MSRARADLVLTGGAVHTMDPAGRVTEALAVTGGRVSFTGTAREAESLDATRVIALGGRSVLPGINDSHLHGAWLGHRWPSLLLEDFAHEEGPLRDPRAAILRTAGLLAPLGITSYTEPGLGPGESGCFGPEVLAEYGRLARAGALKARVTALLLFGELDGPSTLAGLEAGLAEFEPPPDVPGWFRVAGVKIFADGIPPMRTSWTDEPYADGSHGAPLADALVPMIETARAAGHQVAVHATGSRATRVAAGALGDGDYLIHGDVLHPETLKAMAAAGIGLNTQPGIATATAPLLREALGVDGWPVRDALDQGVRLCLSSDAPVLSPDWRVSVAQAVTRADQPLTFDEALRAYTITPAWQDGAAGWKGSLDVGKAADLCVLDADLRTLDPAALPGVDVLLTAVGGRIVHEGSGLSESV